MSYIKHKCKVKAYYCWVCGVCVAVCGSNVRPPELCLKCADTLDYPKRNIGKKFCVININKCEICGASFLSRYKRKGVCSKKCISVKAIRYWGNEPGFKRCTMCKLYLPLIKFSPAKDKRCRSYCKECEKIIAKERKDYLLMKGREYKKSKKGIAKRKEYRKKQMEILGKQYLKKLVCRYSDVSEKEVPDELLEIKRAVVELRRALK